MKDFLNKTVKIGDTIVYATRQSSKIYFHKALVKEIQTRKSLYRGSSEVLFVSRDEDFESPWSKIKVSRLIPLTNPNFIIISEMETKVAS
jgi:hypothetical protein